MVTKLKLTGAHYGVKSWLFQRVTALLMAVFAIIFFIFILYLGLHLDNGIASWQMVFTCPFIKICFQLFFIALFIHAWIGMRDIYMDYIQCAMLKLFFYTLTILWLLFCLFYSFLIIWG